MPGCRALLMEDDQTLRLLLEELLAEEGLAVTVSHTFAEACEVVASGTIALAVLDAWGRSHSSLDVREREEIGQLGGQVPTILLSGRAWVQFTTAEELGVAAVIAKPFELNDLSQRVRLLLGALAWHSS